MASTVEGVLQNVYPDHYGNTMTTPLAGRQVFADANGNGAVDGGEAVATTDLNGSYALSVGGAGTHVVRAVPRAGWGTPAGWADAVTVEVPAGAGRVAARPLGVSMTAPVVIDVLALHAESGGVAWGSVVTGAFRTANQIFANSDTNVRLNLVDVRAAGYAASGDLQTDLSRLAGRTEGHMDWVHGARDQTRADLVVLFDPGPDASVSGRAYYFNPARPTAAAGFAVVAHIGWAGDDYDGYTLAHEIGHNLGADHDVDNRPLSRSGSTHGYRFVGADGATYHDVMAYPPGKLLPFFSNPSLSYAGRPLGAKGVADAARAIRENAPAVARYRAGSSTPTPRVQPKPVTPPTTPAPEDGNPTGTPPPPVAPSPVAVTAVSTRKKPVRAGSRVTATARVRNESSERLSGKLVVEFFLSSDEVLDASDARVGRKTVNGRLRPKAIRSASARFGIEKETGAGTYHVLAVATPAGRAAAGSGPVAEAPLRVVAAPAPHKAVKAKPGASIFRDGDPVDLPQ